MAKDTKEIVLKALEGAPEFIAQGVRDVTLKDGYYRTAHRAFADSIIANGHATEVEDEKTTNASEEADASEEANASATAEGENKNKKTKRV